MSPVTLSSARMANNISRHPVGGNIATFNSVVKKYNMDGYQFTAIKNADCSIPKGEITFVYGPSGSGKSTFLNMLGMLDKPDEGNITILGQDVLAMNDNQAADFRSRHIGFIFQSFNLLPVLSVRENVEFPLLRHNISRQERRAKAEYYLESVGLKDYSNRRLGEISGGQRQRVAIARALITTPELVIADEPTANLDSATSDEIINLMLEMRSQFDTSFVICTHNENLLNESGRLIHIVDGKLQDIGGLQ
ncbi:ABC transporter ATP-binding protein [Raoultella ornithinolytica]|uniref:ABC transporter ATP-binding protein n=1 Tax=Raoultella ornithinolytica TaxID=54291 RepID=UPI00071FB2D2|nr:ABC transporter ATP-binding protein [Raoultella ornithinolytica]ALQ47404.1 ABC transporter, ATP-binding protein [Raoultella ornithinolytica]EKX4892931.1 ABC transporter ATP-binding protein [Raoultella ornithinolytica]ELT0603175.1 ABC transporter ATP-binding protein [Raoultella ornithinolytica]ELT0734525.1 ABC transporter ATP-binding protein [Raoultella ornithinolytica]MDS0887892.1 ABC transporter ATP-binding protein [Raoultella ornithinolytica]